MRCLPLLLSIALAGTAEAASLVLHNARIYTVNAEQPWASAMVIDEDGSIVAIGEGEDVADYVDDETESVDLGGRLVLPGFQDSHAHVLDASSEAQGDCPLQADSALDEWLDEIGTCAKASRGDWLLGSGFSLHTLLDSGESPRALLDEIDADSPIAIMEETSHSYWLNSKALQLAGFAGAEHDPVGGVILRDAQGEPSGVVLDNAGDLVMDKALPPSKALQQVYYQAVLDGQEALASNGITSVADARVFWRRGHLDAWQRAQREDRLKARTTLGLWAYPQMDDKQQLAELKALYAPSSADSLLRVSQIKLYVDGIVHNTTARLRQPYGHSLAGVNSHGLYYFTPERLERYARELSASGFDMHIHTIGDQAVRDALDAIEQATSGRHRLTHVELVDKTDLPRFRQLNVIADFQPSRYFTTSFLEDNQPLIGERAYQMLPLRALYDSGARVTLSSDWDVNPLSPLGIMQNALSLGERGLPNLDAAIKAYTLDAAYTLRQEDDTGSLEVGKQADLLVLDKNIFDMPVHQIGKAKVLWTLLGGEETYRDKSF
ncbi:MAG: amidohydrolase [Gammaproteobacteria bacterium]|nr:amidohydrolase [Gammaproteobacteria bacterium]MBU2157869.1 amidohydrolase [Gammaproteobacteria bacterium]MBU2255127.1 amidohydrolase [Gammaproteobacteria bacterium]MBU2293751.1 amidohydrolase [Gammaproteobacteria bacterium]